MVVLTAWEQDANLLRARRSHGTLRLLLAQFDGVPVVLFGDLDPNGVRIARHLRESWPGLRRLVPEFWREYLPTHALERDWPDNLSLEGEPPLVQDLASCGLWLEQEPIVLDPRLPEAMRESLEG